MQEAKDTVCTYESRVRSTAKLAPADGTFDADPSGDVHCQAVVTAKDGFDQIGLVGSIRPTSRRS